MYARLWGWNGNAWTWPLTSNWCLCQENLDLFLHFSRPNKCLVNVTFLPWRIGCSGVYWRVFPRSLIVSKEHISFSFRIQTFRARHQETGVEINSAWNFYLLVLLGLHLDTENGDLLRTALLQDKLFIISSGERETQASLEWRNTSSLCDLSIFHIQKYKPWFHKNFQAIYGNRNVVIAFARAVQFSLH
jgi:hypothetical protein